MFGPTAGFGHRRCALFTLSRSLRIPGRIRQLCRPPVRRREITVDARARARPDLHSACSSSAWLAEPDVVGVESADLVAGERKDLGKRELAAVAILLGHTPAAGRQLFALVAGPQLEAIIAFGNQAQEAIRLWSERPPVHVCNTRHPSWRNRTQLNADWRAAINQLQGMITPDHGLSSGVAGAASITSVPIPVVDLPFGTCASAVDPHGKSEISRSRTGGADEIVWRVR